MRNMTWLKQSTDDGTSMLRSLFLKLGQCTYLNSCSCFYNNMEDIDRVLKALRGLARQSAAGARSSSA